MIHILFFVLLSISFVPAYADDALEVSVKGDLFSIDAKDADLRNVLSRLSSLTSTRIIAVGLEDGLPLRITITLKNKPIAEALESILSELPAGGLLVVNNDISDEDDDALNLIYVLVRQGVSSDLNQSDIVRRKYTELSKQPNNHVLPYVFPQTEKEILWASNHRSLLAVQKKLRDLLREIQKQKVPMESSLPDFKKWALVLYRDAILAQVLSKKPHDPERDVLLEEFATSLEPHLDMVQSVIPTSNKYYGKHLRELIELVYQENTEDTSKRQIIDLASKFNNLLKRRKRYSDNLYKTQMRKYLRDESIKIDKKVSYMGPFVENEDWELVEYGASYFQDLSEQQMLSNEEQRHVEKLKNQINRKMKK